MLLRSRTIIRPDAIDQQENSQNLFNQENLSELFEKTINKSYNLRQLPGRDLAQNLTRRTSQRIAKRDSQRASRQNELPIKSRQSATASNKSNRNGQSNRSRSSSSVQPGKRKKSKPITSTYLERLQEEYCSIPKRLHPRCGQFLPFDCVRPTYLLKEALNSHRLNDIIRLYSLNAKEKSICPYLLAKTGFLLFRKFIESKPELSEELCNDLVDFVKHIRFLTAMPTAELFLDFFVFCYETDNRRLLEEFGDLNHHVTPYYHLSIKQLRQNFEMVQGLAAFIEFFKEFKEDKFDFKRYERDEFKSKDFTHICLQLQKLTTSSEYDQALDHLLLCLVDLLILFRKLDKAKELLFAYYERHPTNLNAVIYILKFNELHLNDPEVFQTFFGKLVRLDPGHKCLIYYLNRLRLPVGGLIVLLGFVDYAANKDDRNAWQLIYTKLSAIESGSPEETAVKEFYETVFASYWPTYQFTNVSVKINPADSDFLFYKAHVFHFFQPKLSEKFVAQVKLMLTLAKSDKLELLNQFEF